MLQTMWQDLANLFHAFQASPVNFVQVISDTLFGLWSPFQVKNINALERVQRVFTKHIDGYLHVEDTGKKSAQLLVAFSIPGISDHSIVLVDYDLKTPITNKPQRRVYRWSKADWLKIKGLATTFAESFLALANSRSVNDNYVVFRKFMEGLLKTDIPSKLSARF